MTDTALPATTLPTTSPVVAMTALNLAGALQAALSSGLLQLLEHLQPASADELATCAEFDATTVRLVLDALEYGGVVRRDGTDRWVVVDTVDAWTLMLDSADEIRVLLESGQVARNAADRRDAGESYRRLSGLIGELSDDVARSWATRHARPGESILEIGGGAAPWSRAVLAHDPSSVATVVDLPEVVAVMRPRTSTHRAADRIRWVGADAFTFSTPERFDLIVVAGFCRLFDDAANEALFQRVADLLAPDGRVLISDAIDTPTARRRGLAVYAVGLAARTEAGRVYELSCFERWLAHAGLAAPTVADTPLGAVTLLLSHRSSPLSDTTNRMRHDEGASYLEDR